MLRRVLPALAVAGAFLFAGMYVLTAVPRLLYPHDLDFLENNSLMQALRFAAGQPVYAPPAADFVATIYTPFYTWLGGGLFRVVPPGFLPLRLISFMATLGVAGLVGVIAWRESRQHWLSLASAGLFLGGYRLTGFWYDLARVDALALLLTLLGLTFGIYASGSRLRFLLAALTLALAFFTKQTSLAFGVTLLLYHLLRSTPHALRWLALPFVAFSLLPLLTFHFITNGWFSFYILTAASADATELGRVLNYVGVELFGWLGALTLTALVALWLTIRQAGWRGLWPQPWWPLMGVAVVVSGIGRASVGGNLNNLMPVYACLCLAPALLARAMPAPSLSTARGMGLVALALLLQLALGVYNPLRYIPTSVMLMQGEVLIAQLQPFNGPVLVMIHPYYAWRAGHPASAQVASLWHLHHWLGRPWPDDLVQRLGHRYYLAIISDESLFETEPSIYHLLRTNYPLTETLSAPMTLTGLSVQPKMLYLPAP